MIKLIDIIKESSLSSTSLNWLKNFYKAAKIKKVDRI